MLIDAYFSGQKLYGEDLSDADTAQWFADELEGYYELSKAYTKYEYSYHALNVEHGFRHLPSCRYARVLGIGSAHGDEFECILDRCGEITILEPSEGLTEPAFNYVRPDISGIMPFEDNWFDLITCFSVLHHVPKVSTYLREIARVLSPTGYALISEPIVSMGDWRTLRPGLTKHERGIPLSIFRSMLINNGLSTYREHLTSFALTSRWRYILMTPPYNNNWVVKLDSLLCSLPIWSKAYHPRWWGQKLRATGVFFIVRKATASDPQKPLQRR
jgi:SAM-dependent methyltransferase